jgi:creatinine amidohydrolase
MRRYLILFILGFFIFGLSAVCAQAQDTNPLFKETKIKNYLPHMTWYEVEQALKKTDMVIIPVGSIEQHGKHLPLGTDSYGAIEVCKLIAQETDVIIAPVVLVGLSEHHMGFPGSLTLSPATFEAVLFESAQCLMRHGFKKFMIYNGHGGNTQSCENVLQRINQETSAVGIFLNNIDIPPMEPPVKEIPFDWHAGEGETSYMLYLTNSLVDMSKAEKPVLTLPPEAEKAYEKNLGQVASAFLFRPKATGKKASSREMSNIGVFTTGDPKNATVEQGKRRAHHFVKAAVKYIEAWRKIE